jgi:hypothetical protein
LEVAEAAAAAVKVVAGVVLVVAPVPVVTVAAKPRKHLTCSFFLVTYSQNRTISACFRVLV